MDQHKNPGIHRAADALNLLNKTQEILARAVADHRIGRDASYLEEIMALHDCPSGFAARQGLSEVIATLSSATPSAAEPVAMLARYPAEISTAHGPWLPSRYDEGETYCERCLTRSVFADKRKCEPHIVSAPQAETSATASGDAEREALTDERKAYYAAFPGAVPPGDDMRWQGWQARAALHSTGKPDVVCASCLGEGKVIDTEGVTWGCPQHCVATADTPLSDALEAVAEPVALTEHELDMDQALAERDEREGVINSILDEVLGQDRHEWSSSYRFADAIEDVKTRMWALTRPPVPEEAKDAARKPLSDAQIEAGRKATFSTGNPFCPCDSKTMRKAVRWAERTHGIKES